LVNLGQLYQQQQKLDQALETYLEALALLQVGGGKANIAVLLNNMVGLYQARHQGKQAQSCYEQALALDQELGHRAGMARELMNLGALFVEQGDFAKAELRLREAVELFEALDSPQLDQARSWLARAQAGSTRSKVYRVSLN
jgi:tetratricopeptide (TPR) repeat protein